MQTRDIEGDIRVDLFVRNELPPPARDRAEDMNGRLSELVDRGAIETVARHTWASRVSLAECADPIRDQYLSFTAWATDEDASLSPFFQTRQCFTPADGDYTDWLVLPAVCLAIYEDDELTSIYPHASGGESWTVDDGINALTAAAIQEPAQRSMAAD